MTRGLVMITGAHGFIGRELASTISTAGYEILAVGRARADQTMQSYAGQTIDGELSDLSLISSIDKHPDCIVHAASNSGRRPHSTSDLRRDNVRSTMNILKFAQERGVNRIIYLSSVSVHGQTTTGFIDRNSPLEATDAYGVTKCESEQLLLGNESGIEVISLRLPGVVGVGAPQHLLGRWLQSAVGGLEMVVSNPTQPFNNVLHVNDLSRFILQILKYPPRPRVDFFPLASSDPVPILKVAQLISELTGSIAQITAATSPIPGFVIDDSYARSIYNYESQSTLGAVHEYVHNEGKYVHSINSRQ